KLACLVILLEEHRDLLSWLLEDRDAAAGPRLRGSAPYAQLEVRERLRWAAHVLRVVETPGTRLGSVGKLPVSGIDDPLGWAGVRHVLWRLRLGLPTVGTSGNQPLPESLRFGQHAERLQLAVGCVGFVHAAADSHPDAAHVRRPVRQPLDRRGSLRDVRGCLRAGPAAAT